MLRRACPGEDFRSPGGIEGQYSVGALLWWRFTGKKLPDEVGSLYLGQTDRVWIQAFEKHVPTEVSRRVQLEVFAVCDPIVVYREVLGSVVYCSGDVIE